MNDLISVIVPYFNEQRWVRNAMLSVAAQDYRPIELVMVDDGSSDNSRAVVESTECHGISVVRTVHHDNKGLSAARNTGYLASSGTYITYLDADDVMCPDRLSRMIHKLKASPELDILIGKDRLLVEPDTEVPHEMMRGRENGVAPYLPSLLCHRTAHERVGGFDIRFRSCEDGDWHNRATQVGLAISVCDIVAIERRMHGSNMSYRGDLIMHYRLKSVHEINTRRRQNASHRVDFLTGLPELTDD